MTQKPFNPTKIDDLIYAQELTALWRQYDLAKGDRPAEARAHLQNIVRHCKHALLNQSNDPAYFVQHWEKSERLLKEMN